MVTRDIEKKIFRKNLKRRCRFWIARGYTLLIIIVIILLFFDRMLSERAVFIIMFIMIFIVPLLSFILYAMKQEGVFKDNFKEIYRGIFKSSVKQFEKQIEKDDISNMKDILLEEELTSKDNIQRLINYFDKFLLQKTEFQLVTFLIPLLIPLSMSIALFMREFDFYEGLEELSEGLMQVGGAIGTAVLIIIIVSSVWKFIVFIFFKGNTRYKIIYDVLNQILLKYDLEKCNKEENLEIGAKEKFQEYEKIEDSFTETEEKNFGEENVENSIEEDIQKTFSEEVVNDHDVDKNN